MEPVRYDCLGCDHCFPAVAQNFFNAAFPKVELPGLGCEFEVRTAGWPPVVGEYFVVDKAAPVAVTTLASVELAEAVAHRKPDGLAIVGKTETENIGLDKIIKNVITNSAIQFLIVAGRDSEGHQTGRTLLALAENGVDARGRVIGSPGKRPVLQNVSAEEIRAFRAQVQVIDMIGQVSLEAIVDRIEALAQSKAGSCGCSGCTPTTVSITPTIMAVEPDRTVKLDRAGYFVIVPLADRGSINVEHYDYDHTLLRVIEGRSAQTLYKMIVDKGWVTELSHAAYLGRELARAELSLEYGFKFIQDKA
jgi:tetrahydromethanopterin S-methyltransferase subunit A